MDDDRLTNRRGQYDDTLPLPTEPQSLHAKTQAGSSSSDISANDAKTKDHELAADIIRRKVEEAYRSAPALQAEAQEIKELTHKEHLSKHQLFVQGLIASRESLEQMQAAWHDYYADLPDDQKHEVWREFYANQPQTARYVNFPTSLAEEVTASQPNSRHHPKRKIASRTEQKLSDFKARVAKRLPPEVRQYRPPRHVRSIVFGLLAGFIAVLILLFSFFNERIIAPFIQPSRNIANTPLISDAAVGTAPEIIIPKINVQIPVVYDVKTTKEDAVLAGLENGVVHYADSAQPGQNGNVVIVGHSSNNIFNKGKYKFAFVLLNRLDNGDSFYLQKDGKRYTYQVYQRTVVKPEDVSVLGDKDKPATATLITCDPPGTSTNRLVVVGQQISPDPTGNAAKTTNNALATQSKTIPGNAPSLWHTLWVWFSR
ncbi:class D sortase [Candidatus Saccharibacteria bacterium]|nr:class D sortase [Candidatus Saccharibacteria bacterium]